MPSLREYVLTLKKYNPNAQDRLLKIYLLKAGWPIVDIEKVFAEANAVNSSIAPIVTVPAKIATEIEVAAPELEPDAVSLAVPAYLDSTPIIEKPPIIDGSLDKNASDMPFGGGMDIKGPVVSSASILAALSDSPVAPAMPTPIDPAQSYIAHSPLVAPQPVSASPASFSGTVLTSIAPSFDRPQMSSAQPFSSASIMAQSTTTNVPVQMPSAMPSSIQKPKSKTAKKLMIWLCVIALLALIGFGYMRFVHGIYLFANAPIEKNSVLSHIAGSISRVDTATYSTRLNFKMMPREPGVESFDAIVLALKKDSAIESVISQNLPASSTASSTLAASSTSPSPMASVDSQDYAVDEFLAAFPVDGAVNLQIEGLYRKDPAANDNDGKWHVVGDYSGEGLAAKFDIESIVKKGVTHIKAKAFPEMFFDIHAIRDKWISIDESDTESVASALPWLEIFDVPNPRPVNYDKQIARLVAIAGEEKVLEVVGDPQKIIRPGTAWYMPQRVLYSYQLQPNLEHFIAFIERSNTILRNEFGTSSILVLTGEKKQKLMSREFEKFFNYFVSNGYVKMTVDKGGSLVDIAGSLKLVGDEKQALVTADISIGDINKGINIDYPKPEMTFSDAYVLISGQSKELLQLKKQAKTVEAIRAQIGSYQNAHGGEVPDTLNGMVLPNLPFATSSYAYKKVSKTSYLLSYQVVLPPLPTQFYELPQSLIGFDSSTAASSGTDLSMQYLKFVNGKNTASEKTISIEADVSKRLDSDRDRITNSLEQYIGTNITKKDSDDDGVDDYEELQKGGNPLGAGSWVGGSKE